MSFQDQNDSGQDQGQQNQQTPPENKIAVDQEQFNTIQKRLDDKDSFIDTLKSERREDQEKLTSYEQKLQDMQERLEALTGKLVEPPASQEAPASISLDDVDQFLSKREVANKQQSNLDKVAASMSEQYGDGWQAKLDELAVQKGMTPKMAVELAKQSPDFFVQTFGSGKSPSPSPTKSSINTQGMPTPAPEATKVTPELMRDSRAYKAEMLRRLQEATKS